MDFTVAWTEADFEAILEKVRVFRFPNIPFADDWSAGCSPVFLKEFLTYWSGEFDLRKHLEPLLGTVGGALTRGGSAPTPITAGKGFTRERPKIYWAVVSP